MKPTTPLAGLSLTFLLAGCANEVRLTATDDPMCPRVDVLELEYGDARLLLDRECIEVSGGTTVMLNLPAGAREAGKVRTKFRGIGNKWLDKSNSAGSDVITLTTPADGDTDKDQFKFEIHVKDIGLLDPRIVVQ